MTVDSPLLSATVRRTEGRTSLLADGEAPANAQFIGGRRDRVRPDARCR